MKISRGCSKQELHRRIDRFLPLGGKHLAGSRRLGARGRSRTARCEHQCGEQSGWVPHQLSYYPDVGPVQGRNPSGLRFLRRFRLARTVEGDRLANERLEGGLVNFFSFVDVDRAACVSLETRVEETGRILQRRALGEGKLHDILVGFASADDAVVRPDRSAHPLPLLDDVRVCFLDELAHSAEGFSAPVPELGDSFRDELRCRLALARARLFHVLILEVPEEGLRQIPPHWASVWTWPESSAMTAAAGDRAREGDRPLRCCVRNQTSVSRE